MFEESLVESRVGQGSSSKRWTMVGSIALQLGFLSVVMLLPLLHPEGLPFHVDAPRVLVPLIPNPPVRVEQVQRMSGASASNVALPGVAPSATMPSLLPSLHPVEGDQPVLGPIGGRMTMGNGLPGGIGLDDGHRPMVSVRPAPGLLHVSTGVSQGMLLAPIRPVYPVVAKAGGVQGVVIVEAVISRTGTIESLHVVSGPLMLQNAALDAIREARYRPYRLNGEPTEVETTITVNFRLGG